MNDARAAQDPISSSRVQGDALLVSVRGEVDLQTSPLLRGALLDLVSKNRPKRLVVNLASVAYMDSSGIAVLVEAMQHMRKSGGKVFLSTVQPRVRSVLEIARLDSIFVLTTDDAAALAK
jgi:anti-sigma B factor antagonist